MSQGEAASRNPRTTNKQERLSKAQKNLASYGNHSWVESSQNRSWSEEASKAYADLGDNPFDDEDELPVAEYLNAAARMKSNKAAGPEGVPAEVFKNSTLAKHELYFFLKQVWRHECVPQNLVLGMFVMIYKRKVSSDDPANYRAIGLLNDA